MDTDTSSSTTSDQHTARRVGAACPHCGSALLHMHEHTEDIYIGELRLLSDELEDAVPSLARWARGRENHDYLVGCARCHAWLDAADLVPATADELDLAYAEFARLSASVSTEWQCDRNAGAVASCPSCGSHELVIAAERDVDLAATFVLEDADDADWDERRLCSQWDVRCTVHACNSCLRPLLPGDLIWQLRLCLDVRLGV